MITSLTTGAAASAISTELNSTESKTPTAQASAGAAFDPPTGDRTSRDHIRHMLFGSPSAVRTTIQLLHKLNYAEPNDWSQPIATGRGNEVMAILTKRIGAN